MNANGFRIVTSVTYWNTYRYVYAAASDNPGIRLCQQKRLKEAGYDNADVHLLLTGHGLFITGFEQKKIRGLR